MAEAAAGSVKPYHHGYLKETLLKLGLEALERDGVEALSLRSLADAAGVSKTAPYRHFPDKETFLGALSDEGFRILHGRLLQSLRDIGADGDGRSRVAAMGRAYMDFAVSHKTLYRLMNSPVACRASEEHKRWARLALSLLAETLAGSAGHGEKTGEKTGGEAGEDAARGVDGDEVVSTWAYIHGLVLLRIDDLYPAALPEPDWDRLAGRMPIFR